MAVTPNYSWPVPVNTDLVKDGADAIKDLGDAIDATVFGLPSGALALINTTTVTAQTTVSFNSVFTATYENYLIIMNLVGSGGGDLNLRVRASGTDLSTSTYNTTKIEMAGAGFFTAAGGNTSVLIGLIRTTKTDLNLNFFAPQITGKNTSITSSGMYLTSGSNHGNVLGGGVVDNTTSYDGFTVIPSTGTITGTIRIYGVQN